MKEGRAENSKTCNIRGRGRVEVNAGRADCVVKGVFIPANAAGNYEEASQLIYDSEPTLCSGKRSQAKKNTTVLFFQGSEMTAV